MNKGKTTLYGVIMLDDNQHGFMGNRSPHSEYPVSRDWEDIDCKAAVCIFNRFDKCTVPSRAKLGEDGRCTGFITEQMIRDDQKKGKK